MSILKRISLTKGNDSVLFLALLCLIYLLVTSGYINATVYTEYPEDINRPLYIEISTNGISTVRIYEKPEQLVKLRKLYRLAGDLKSGDKITIEGNEIAVGSIGGRKKISLGVPIGINSATHEDLTAIDGIGDELAERIINYRTKAGGINSIDELDNIEGIGSKKLESIKRVAITD